MLDLANELYVILNCSDDLNVSQGMYKIKHMHICSADLEAKQCEVVCHVEPRKVWGSHR